ncbi:MAG: SGNH/GDSL hydrolase family protein [Prevotellaceae bacterium]|jgi:acyl-CoA thioesterase-1|nr:SGNH/GDSL hydrolase family protein [Prevotellaceae bacterium]
MKKIIILSIAVLFSGILSAQPQFIKNIKKGTPQTLVVYGSSISTQGNGIYWVKTVDSIINSKYNNKLTVYNSGVSGRSSAWAVEALKDSVLPKKPDAVILEFATTDAVDRFDISPEQSRRYMDYLVDRIKEENPKAEVILLLVSSHLIGEAAAKRSDLEAYNNMYRELAKDKKILLIDITPETKKLVERGGEKELRKYQHDGVHLTKYGATNLVAREVLKAFKIK